jgi:hypothetical protein
MQTMSKVVLIALHDIPWNQQAVMRIETMYSTTCDKTRHVHRGKVSLNGFRWEGEDSQFINFYCITKHELGDMNFFVHVEICVSY